MARDSLRSTLDDLKLGPEAAKDRPYLEAMLRRLGYTETEIRAELGPAVEADKAPARATRGDELAPAREYRLVIPARESVFSFAPPEGAAPGTDSPFEAFERVEFEPATATDDVVEFEEAAPDEAEALEFVEEPEPVAAEPAQETMQAQEFEEAPLQEFQEADVEALKADAPSGAAEDLSLDTFGTGDVDAKPKTRVRVKRVRAKSKQEAEGKVASGSRKVIKSIPVDIVERWGPGEKDKAGKKEDK